MKQGALMKRTLFFLIRKSRNCRIYYFTGDRKIMLKCKKIFENFLICVNTCKRLEQEKKIWLNKHTGNKGCGKVLMKAWLVKTYKTGTIW